MTLATGMKFGPYEIQDRLGEGGMGVVYRARDPRLGRTVALKVLPTAYAADDERVRRFAQEAKAAGSLSHPAILAVFDVGVLDGVPFMVSELLEGETLRERLTRGFLPPSKAVDYAVQIADGLAAAHDKGIVHRDLKPENLFLTGEGRVKILDFGLAKLVARAAPEVEATASMPAKTGAGAVMGTIGYMSPEQVSGDAVDHRTDIFSFGAVLYEMLCGRRAFSGATASETLRAIFQEDPRPLTDGDRVVPEPLERIVRRCFEKRPGERFQSARDLAFALQSLSGSTPSGAASSTARLPWGARNRERVAWTAAALALVAAGVFGLRGRHPDIAAPDPVRLELSLPEGTTLEPLPTGNSIAVSPDGRRVAFVGSTMGHPPRIWIRTLDNPAAALLAGTEDAFSPFWSPDGRHLAFFAGGRLRRVALVGGPPEDLGEVEFGNAGTWGSDGTILYSEFVGRNAGLHRISAAGGVASPVELDVSGSAKPAYWPQFLPDGRHFLFLTGPFTGGGRENRLNVGTLGSKASTPLFAADSPATFVSSGHLLFVRDGVLLAQPFDPDRLVAKGEAGPLAAAVTYVRPTGSAQYGASADGRVVVYNPPPAPTRLTWLDREGRTIGTVGEPAYVAMLRLSPDGTRVVVAIGDLRKGAGDIWIDDLGRGQRSRLTQDSGDAMAPAWHPGGQSIAFSSARDGPPQIYVRKAESGGEEKLVPTMPGVQIVQDWSPDARRIVFENISASRQTRRQLWLVTLANPTSVAPFEPGPSSKTQGRFSPDGRWLAFGSDETGRPEIFVAALDGGSRQQVSAAGGSLPRWRHDGRELFFLGLNKALMAVSVTPGPRPAFGVPRTLFMAGTSTEPDFDVSADGQRFLMTLAPGGKVESALTVLFGWRVGPASASP